MLFAQRIPIEMQAFEFQAFRSSFYVQLLGQAAAGAEVAAQNGQTLGLLGNALELFGRFIAI